MKIPRVTGFITCGCGAKVPRITRNQIRCEACALAKKRERACNYNRKNQHA